ncbi:hypothetical protein ACSSS7_003246 [Eimeria intestinalis]
MAFADDPTPLLKPAYPPQLPCEDAHQALPSLKLPLIATAEAVAAHQEQDGEVLVGENLATAHGDDMAAEAGLARLVGEGQKDGFADVTPQSQEEAARLAAQAGGLLSVTGRRHEEATRLVAQMEGQNGHEAKLERGRVLKHCHHLKRALAFLKTADYPVAAGTPKSSP